MTFPGPHSAQIQRKNKMVIKQALLAPIWTRIGVPYIVFREESDGDIPEANFCEKTSKNEHTNFESENQK